MLKLYHNVLNSNFFTWITFGVNVHDNNEHNAARSLYNLNGVERIFWDEAHVELYMHTCILMTYSHLNLPLFMFTATSATIRLYGLGVRVSEWVSVSALPKHELNCPFIALHTNTSFRRFYHSRN